MNIDFFSKKDKGL